jgi:ribosome biogenesis GTPase
MHPDEESRITARVSLSRGERARVLLDGNECEAVVAGTLIYSGGTVPVTGDWIKGRRVEPELVLIEEVLPRRSQIARRAAGRRSDEQVLATNVDIALIVCGLDGDFNLRRVERYLALCHEGGVEPVIVLNKIDLCADVEGAVEQVGTVMRSARVLPVSARTGAGCECLKELFANGATGVLLGSSGTGKSSLLNQLMGAAVRPTSAVRESDSRGRHTTTERELTLLRGGGALIDTPGLREIQLVVSEESIDRVFDEIAELAAQCRFGDCTHREEPGCAVRPAVPADRLESFHKLSREVARLTDPAGVKLRWRAIHKAARRFYKERGR